MSRRTEVEIQKQFKSHLELFLLFDLLVKRQTERIVLLTLAKTTIFMQGS